MNVRAVAAPIHVTPEEWALLTALPRKYAHGRKVWAYGSRSTGERLKRYSDLDPALGSPPDMAADDNALEEALDWCSIPFRVELVVLPEVNEVFRKRIEPDLIS